MAIIKVGNRAIDLDAAEIPNLDTSKITSGTFADARISQSSVNQHATDFDDNKIVNDLSTLALRQSSNENKAAYNTNSMYVDVFQDSTGVTSLTNAFRNTAEYMSTISAETGLVFLMDGGEGESAGSQNFYNKASGSDVNRDSISGNSSQIDVDTGQQKFGSNSYYVNNINNEKYRWEFNANSDWNFGTGDFSIDGFIRYGAETHEHSIMGVGDGSNTGDFYIRINEWNNDQLVLNVKHSGGTNHLNIPNTAISPNTWLHICVARKSGTIKVFIDGNSQTVTTSANWSTAVVGNSSGKLTWGAGLWSPSGANAYLDGWRIYKGTAKYFDSNFTPPAAQPTATVANATGSFTSNNITASSSTNKMGAIITYQDNAGTNTLNTDVILKLSADGGSNYSTATLTAMPDFATGIKMAKVNDLSVTAGTSLKYKLEFANQANGSKEARIRGVSLQY